MLRQLFVLLVVVAPVAACQQSSTPSFACVACQTDEDCPNAAVCKLNYCVSGDEDPNRCPHPVVFPSSSTSSGSSASSSTSASSSSSASSTGTSSSSGASSASSSSGSTGLGVNASSGSSASSSSSSGSSTSGSSGSSGSTGIGDWSCLGNEPQLSTTQDSTPLTLVFEDEIASVLSPTSAYDVGINVSLCDIADLSCSNPFDMGTTDINGTVIMTAPLDGGPFVGYVDAIDPNQTPDAGMLEDLVYMAPFVSDLHLNPVTFSEQDRAQYGALLGNPNLDTEGAVVAEIHDCTDRPVAGATMTTSSTDPNTHLLYIAGGFPSVSATSTDSSGRLLIMNVPASDAFQLTTYNDQGQIAGQYTVIVRPGAMTSIFARPNQ